MHKQDALAPHHVKIRCDSTGPAEAFDLFPKTAISQDARDKLNRKTDNLPSLKKTGQELVGGADPIGAKDPQDIGKAIDKYAQLALHE